MKLEMQNISKRFPGVLALDNVTFEAESGSILGLVGVNGAGKSTLMNILGGVITPDEGQIVIDKQEYNFSSPRDAENAGIGFIHQEPQFFAAMTVYENIYISHMFKKGLSIFVDRKKAAAEAKKHLQELGSDIKPKTKLEDISIGNRQIVEIARALAADTKIIIFDEPTSSLSVKEKEILFSIINKLKNSGKIVIYISHFLDEIKEICDKFLVLRNGIIVGNGDVADVQINDIVKFIIGKDIVKNDEVICNVKHAPVLEVNNLNSSILKDISFNLNRCEILGIWGLMGSGRTELVRAMFGIDQINSGTIYLADKDNKLRRIAPKKLLKQSGYITENRHEDGLLMPKSLWENISLPSLRKYTSKVFKFLKVINEKKDAQTMIDKLNIKSPGYNTLVKTLSGGNQQKVIFAKWLNKNVDILIMDEPTRGVDVGAKFEIYDLIRQLAANGTAIIFISSEIEEILRLCNRVIVLREGRLVGETNGKDINNTVLMNLSMGEAE